MSLIRTFKLQPEEYDEVVEMLMGTQMALDMREAIRDEGGLNEDEANRATRAELRDCLENGIKIKQTQHEEET